MALQDFARPSIEGFSSGFSQGIQVKARRDEMGLNREQQDREFRARQSQQDKVQAALEHFQGRQLQQSRDALIEQTRASGEREEYNKNYLEQLGKSEDAAQAHRDRVFTETVNQNAWERGHQNDGRPMVQVPNPFPGHEGEYFPLNTNLVPAFLNATGAKANEFVGRYSHLDPLPADAIQKRIDDMRNDKTLKKLHPLTGESTDELTREAAAEIGNLEVYLAIRKANSPAGPVVAEPPPPRELSPRRHLDKLGYRNDLMDSPQ